MSVSPIAGLQLNVLQLPEVARLETPILAQAQIANAQVPAIVRQYDQQLAETIQPLPYINRRPVPSSLDSHTRERQAFREPVRPPSRRVQHQAVTLAAASPANIGAYVDIRA